MESPTFDKCSLMIQVDKRFPIKNYSPWKETLLRPRLILYPKLLEGEYRKPQGADGPANLERD